MELLKFDISLKNDIISGKYKVVTKNNRSVIINRFEDDKNREYPIEASISKNLESVRIRYNSNGEPCGGFDKSYSLMLLNPDLEDSELITILMDFYGERELLGDCGHDIWKYVRCYNILEEYAKKIRKIFEK